MTFSYNNRIGDQLPGSFFWVFLFFFLLATCTGQDGARNILKPQHPIQSSPSFLMNTDDRAKNRERRQCFVFWWQICSYLFCIFFSFVHVQSQEAISLQTKCQDSVPLVFPIPPFLSIAACVTLFFLSNNVLCFYIFSHHAFPSSYGLVLGSISLRVGGNAKTYQGSYLDINSSSITYITK